MPATKLIWHTAGRSGDSRRFYGESKGNLNYNWGHVFKTDDGEWGASWDGGFDTFPTRKEAMARVEREVARQRRRKSR